MKKHFLIFAALCAAAMTFSACAEENADERQHTESLIVSMTAETAATAATTVTEGGGILGDFTVQTVSKEEQLSQLIEGELPDIVITDGSSDEDIIRAGVTAAKYFSPKARKYFTYSGYSLFRYGDMLTFTDEDGNEKYYYEGLGIYTDNENRNIFNLIPLDFADAKYLIMSDVGTTEQGFSELCDTAPSGYYEIDGKFCIRGGDGGDAGWDSCYIKDFTRDGDTVTYNCELIGYAEEWGYAEDAVRPFTFRIKNEDGLWKLDGVSDGDAFIQGFIGDADDKAIHDGVISILFKYDDIFRITRFGALDCDTEDTMTSLADGSVYYKVTDERFPTWESWREYVESVYTEVAAKKVIEKNIMMGEENSLYTLKPYEEKVLGGISYEITGEHDGVITAIFHVTAFFEHNKASGFDNEIQLTMTENGMRIIYEGEDNEV